MWRLVVQLGVDAVWGQGQFLGGQRSGGDGHSWHRPQGMCVCVCVHYVSGPFFSFFAPDFLFCHSSSTLALPVRFNKAPDCIGQGSLLNLLAALPNISLITWSENYNIRSGETHKYCAPIRSCSTRWRYRLKEHRGFFKLFPLATPFKSHSHLKFTLNADSQQKKKTKNKTLNKLHPDGIIMALFPHRTECTGCESSALDFRSFQSITGLFELQNKSVIL